MKQRILIADDEPDVLKLVSSNFSSAGFDVVEAIDGNAALAGVRSHRPNLIVLDVLMPGLTGLEVTRVLKGDDTTAAIPIVLLSARAHEVDRVLGFELGADDFVTKPFSPRELVLRACSILRRKTAPPAESKAFSIGGIAIDLDRHSATIFDAPVALTAIEFKLITVLARAPGRVLSRDELLNRVWGIDSSIEIRTVDTHVRRLREKLGKAGRQIKTVRGFGYRLDE